MKVIFDICISFTGEQPYVFMSFSKAFDLPVLPVVGTRFVDGNATFTMIDVEYTFDFNKRQYRIDVLEKSELKKCGKVGVRKTYEAFLAAGWKPIAQGRGLWPILENAE